MGYENARLRIHYVNRDEQFESVIPHTNRIIKRGYSSMAAAIDC